MKYYFEHPNFKLLNGNCLELLDEFPDDTFDSMFFN